MRAQRRRTFPSLTRSLSVSWAIVLSLLATVGCDGPAGTNESWPSTLPAGSSAGALPGHDRFDSNRESVQVKVRSALGFLITDAVRINGAKPGYFLVGTGANITVVAPDVAQALDLIPYTTMEVAGKQIGGTYYVKTLTFGPLTLRPHLIGSTNLDALQKFHKPIVGVLGADVLGKIPFTVDYRQETITLHNPQQFKRPGETKEFALAVINRQKGYGPFSDNEIVGVPAVSASLNGRETRMMLDTGFNRGVAVAPSDARKQPARIGRTLHTLRTVTAIGRQQDQTRVFVVDELVLFGETLRDVPFGSTSATVKGPPPRGEDNQTSAVGGMLLRNYRLTFDMRRGKLWVAQAQMPPPLAKDTLNRKNLAGVPPLVDAVRYGDVAMLKHLLKQGASVRFVNDSGYNVLHMTVFGGSAECARLLLAQESCPKPTESTPDGLTPLMFATGLSEPALVTEFVKAGADLNARTTKGNTALRYAVNSGNIGIAGLLLKEGARPDITLTDGQPPIALAASKGNYQMVRLLAKHGAPLDFVTKSGQTLVHFAALGGSLKILDLTLKGLPKGAVNRSSNDGVTPLMIAADEGHLQSVEALIKAGADISANASVNGSIGKQAAIHFAAMKGRDNVVRFLLDRKVSSDQGTGKGLTPLMLAAGSGYASTVGLLLSNDADVNKTDTQGMTPLHYAAKLGHPGAIPILLKAGARITSGAQKGVRPLDIAALCGNVDAARLLVEAGADPTAKGKHGRSAIDFAKGKGHQAMTALLQRLSRRAREPASRPGG